MTLIVHRMSSEGDGAGVNITSRTVSQERFFGGDCVAGVKFDADGSLYSLQSNGGYSLIAGEWLAGGTNSDFFVSATVDSGTLTNDGGDNQVLSTDRLYDILQTGFGTKTTVVTFNISTDVSGTPIVATAQITMIAIYGDPD